MDDDDDNDTDDDNDSGRPRIRVKGPGNRKAAKVLMADIPLSNTSSTIVHVISEVLLP
jgi:hypothetical protein